MSRKLKVVMCSDDPYTILSYGLLSKMLIDRLKDDFDIHYVSLQRPMGKPIKIDGFTLYSSRCEGERNPINLPHVINKVKPDIVWTNFDIQIYEKFKDNRLIPKGVTWIGWIPWDNHDMSQIGRARNSFKDVDVKMAISLFGFEILRTHGVRMDGYIYNIVDTDVFNPMSKKKLDEFKSKLSWYNPEEKYLLFVGRPNWRKRMTHMMAIMKELQVRGRNDIKLILHSNIYDPARNTNLPEIIDSFGLNESIILTHFGNYDTGITKEELCGLYNLADLYISPHGGEGFCIFSNTNILTDDGYKPIREIKVGDRVRTKTDYKRVTETFKRNYKGKIIKIERWYDTQPLKCTPEHKILTYKFKWKNSKHRYYEKKWKRADEVKTSDYLYIPEMPKIEVKEPQIPIKGKNKWWFLGFYLAEGCCYTDKDSNYNNGTVVLACHSNRIEKIINEKLNNLEILYKHANLGYEKEEWRERHFRTSSQKNKGRIDLYSCNLTKFLKKFGHKAPNKFIPDDIFQYLKSDKEARKEFIDGLYYGDGNSNLKRKERPETTKYYSLEMTSRRLLKQIQELLMYDGIFSSLNKSREKRKEKIKGILYNCQKTWRLRWSSNNRYVLSCKGSIIDKEECEMDGCFVKIKRISEVEADTDVYNIEVDADNFDDHSYTTKQGVIHNCMPIAESMACGTPFIATNHCTTPEFAGQDNERGFPAPFYYPRDRLNRIVPDGGVIRPYPEVKTWVDLIEQALLDDNKLKAMGKNGVKWVREWCSPGVVASKWKEVWESFDTKICGVNGYK